MMPPVEANLEVEGADAQASVLSVPWAGAGRLSAGDMMSNREREMSLSKLGCVVDESEEEQVTEKWSCVLFDKKACRMSNVTSVECESADLG